MHNGTAISNKYNTNYGRPRRYLFLSPPAIGEMQPTLAVAEALLNQNTSNMVYIGSGSSFFSGTYHQASAFQRFLSSLGSSNLKKRVIPIDLGETDDVEDYSRYMLLNNDTASSSSNTTSPSLSPSDSFKLLMERKQNILHLLGTHRHARGDPLPFFNFWSAFAAGNRSDRLNTISKILKIIEDIKPDMIVVDQIYGTPFDAVRYSKLPFVLLAPGHPSFAASVNPFLEPMSMSGTQWHGGSSSNANNILANFKLIFRLLSWLVRSSWAKDTLKLRRWTLGFRWLSIGADVSITPPPDNVEEVCAAIMCNVPDLNFYKRWSPKCHFVGSCTRPAPSVSSRTDEAEDASVRDWLDKALASKHDVVFITFGSMFPFNERDYESMIQALRMVHQSHPNLRVLWRLKKSNDLVTCPLPYVLEKNWIPDIKHIYEHPATKVVVHHGGGNTVNEVVYHGLKHLVIPQWADTYDWAATIAAFNLGEQVDNPGPDLDAREISNKLLQLLEYPDEYEDSIEKWKRKAQNCPGARGAAHIIAEEANVKSDIYREGYKDLSGKRQKLV